MNTNKFVVPADGSCQFWSVAMAYLRSVVNEDAQFRRRFIKLFDYRSKECNYVRELFIRNSSSANINYNGCYEDSRFKSLVSKTFRSKVINAMRQLDLKSKFLETITLQDFGDSHNIDFITSGRILTAMRKRLPHLTIKDLNLGELKYEEAIEKVDEILRSAEKGGRKEFLYDMYLKCMEENTSSWGGHHELLAMSYMLRCETQVNDEKPIKWFDDNECKIHLSYNGSHYEFHLDTNNETVKVIDSLSCSFEQEIVDISRDMSTLMKRKEVLNVERTNMQHSISPNNTKPFKPSVIEDKKKDNAYSSDSLFSGPGYQVKLMFLFLHRALAFNYNFELTTEWKEAEKFDDVVFLLRDKNVIKSGLFLQAKHKLKESKKITYEELLNVGNGEFSLKKYFISYMKMKENPKINNVKIKSLVIFTNIDFDQKTVKSKNKLIMTEKSNPMLHFMSKFGNKTPTHYHLIPDAKIKEILRECSGVMQLAEELVAHLFSIPPKQLTLNSPIFKDFHQALCTHVIDKESKRFREDFVKGENLSASVRNFRTIFFEFISRHKNKDYDFSSKNIILREDFVRQNEPGKSDLPNDIISEEDIKGFFERLVFSMDQPNEVELGQVIEQEVSSSLNLSHSEDIVEQVVRDLVNWSKQKKGEFITLESGKTMFDNAKNIMNSRVGIGLCATYEAKLKIYSEVILFKESHKVNDFLNDDKMHLVQSKNPLLTIIKIFQLIIKHEKYKADDSHIIINLDSLLENNQQICILSAFNTNQLLVIHCDCTDEELNEESIAVQSLFDQLFTILNNKMKKLLVVVNNEINMQKNITERFTLENDETNFNDLNLNSQTMLLDMFLKFQGNLIKLGELIENISDWNEILDGEILTELIRNELLEIGCKPVKLSQLEAAFAIRHKEIEPKNILNALKLNAKEPGTEIFLFTDKTKHSITISSYFDRFIQLFKNKLLKSQLTKFLNIIESSSDFVYTNCKKINIILNEKKEINKEIFKKICYYNSEKFVYWLEIVNGKLHWLQVYDPHFYIKRHFMHPIARRYIKLDEESLANTDERVVLILAEPGMGKSTTLTRLSEHKLRDSWVIRLNLRDYEEQILSLPQDYSETTKANTAIATMLLWVNHPKKSLLSVKLLNYSLNNKMRLPLCIIFDGYDEISKGCQEKFIFLVKYLKAKTHANVWVSSRKERTEDLEKVFGVLSTTFKKLMPYDREDYLRNFYQVRLKLQLRESEHEVVFRKDSGKFDLFFKALLEKVDNVFDKTFSEFLGIPLQMRLLAEGFLPQFEQFIATSTNDKTPDFKDLDVLHFYQRFINVKYDIYFQEKTRLSLGLSSESRRWLNNDLNRMHQRVALKHLFPKEINSFFRGVIKPPFKNEQLEMDPEQEKELMRVGILQVEPFEGRLEFIHQTIAEYFISEFIMFKLRKPKISQAIQKLLPNLLKQYFIIGMFLNERITDADLSRRKLVHLDKSVFNQGINCVYYVYIKVHKLTEFILTFYRDKVWILKQLEFGDVFLFSFHNNKLDCLLKFTKNHYDVIRKYVLNNNFRLYDNAASNSVIKSSLRKLMNTIKCYPKIIEEATRDYYADDLCELFENEEELCELIRKLRSNDDSNTKRMTSYEIEANEILRSFVNDCNKNEIETVRKVPSYKPLKFADEILNRKPYKMRKGKDLIELINKIKEFIKLGERIRAVEEQEIAMNAWLSFEDERECITLRQHATQYQLLSEKLEHIKHEASNSNLEEVDIESTLSLAIELVRNENYKDAKDNLKFLTHFDTDDFWLKMKILETLQLVVDYAIKYRQESFVMTFLGGVEGGETKKLALHFLSTLRTSVTKAIKKFSGELLKAINENTNDAKITDILQRVENNSEGIVRWIKKQLGHKRSKTTLKKFLKVLADHGESTLYEAIINRNRSFIICLKKFPKMYHFSIFNTYRRNQYFNIPLYKALLHNDITTITLLFDALIPYPTILRSLILTPHLETDSKTYLHLALIRCETSIMVVFVSQLNRNMEMMKYVLHHFVSNEEDKLELYEEAVEKNRLQKNSNSLSIFLNRFKSDINNAFKRFFVPADKSVKPAFYLAGERGCKEVMDVLLRVLKSEKVVLWELLMWTDPVSGKTVLHRAAEKGYTQIVDAILSSVRKQPEKLDKLFFVKDNLGHTPLDCAVLNDRQIIRNEFDIELRMNLIDWDGYKLFKDLFKTVDEINYVNKNVDFIERLLYFLSLALNNIPLLVKLILVFAKSFNFVELMVALFENEELRLVLESMNVTKDEYSYFMYYSAIERDNLELIELLIKKGYDVNCSNGYGYTPLMKAMDRSESYLKCINYKTFRNSSEIIEALLNAGADMYCHNMHGVSAYSMAVFSKTSKIRTIFFHEE